MSGLEKSNIACQRFGMENKYELGLEKRPANYQPMTPITALERAAVVFADHPAVIHGDVQISYSDLWGRSQRLASALSKRGISRGDTVSVILSNTPAMLDAHFAVPMTGAVLHSINTRLDAAVIAFQLDHAETKLLIVDREFSLVIQEALALCKSAPIVIDYDDPIYPDDAPHPKGPMIGELEYMGFMDTGDETFEWVKPDDEWDAIALNYTSGTTGNPKGVVSHHRGAALMTYNNTIHADIGQHSVYLWTLPMFHCNGWCFPWTLSLTGSTHVCLRWVRAGAMFDAIADHGVTHLCGAPIVMSTLLNAGDDERRDFDQLVNFNTAAAPPPESVLSGMARAGFRVTHLYGLTETYGPAVVNVWQSDWDALDATAQTQKRSRQGVAYAGLDALDVIDPETMRPVSRDGKTMGEVMFKGNIVMKGYLKNQDANDEVFAGGWFHSGDLGVMHPDGYIQLKDRSKDIIISGGENISSIEVEDALYNHPSVTACAVVAMPHDRFGETPVAFVEVTDADVTEKAIIAHCRDQLAHFKCPRKVVFGPVPKTSTGKIEKFKLRAIAAKF